MCDEYILIRFVTSMKELSLVPYVKKRVFVLVDKNSFLLWLFRIRPPALFYGPQHNGITNGTGEIESNMFCSNKRSEETSVILKRGFLSSFPHA